MKEKIKKFSVFIIIPLLFVSFVQSAILLFIPSQTVYAVTHSEDEQKKRREAYAFKDCIEMPGSGFREVMTEDTININTALSNEDRTVPIGHDVGDADGTKKCGDLGNAVLGYIGFDLRTLYHDGMYDPPGDGTNNPYQAIVLDNDKFNELRDKLNKYIQERMPVTWSEKIRRLRFNLTGLCAVADGNAVGPNSFEINGNKFRYDNGGAGEMISVGHDYDFDGGNDGEVSCGNLVGEAMRLNIFDTSAADILQYESKCWNVLLGNANTYDLIRACTTQMGNTQGHGTDTGNTGEDSGSGGGETAIECNMISWNALKWFLCPLIKIGETAVNALDNLITYMLKFPTDKYFTDNGSLQKAWGNMRNLALGILIIAGLVMVISQAIGTGPFDAYTIKKVMPRIVFAVIFISLSFEILKFLVEFSNIAGLGVRSLIEGAFNLSGSGQVSFSNGALAIGNGAIVGVGLSLGFMGILSLMATALLGVLLAFLVLAARQMVIIMLVIVAPIAIACYILPNTEKVWKMWWDFFIRAIFAFPIITAFIASGRAFAQVSTQGPPGDAFTNTLTSILAFIAYFGPYFALPYAFKLAGGAVAQIGGVVNDRSRGAFDRMKNYRGRKMKENWQAIQAGNRFHGGTDNNWRGRLNRGLQTGAMVGNAGLNPLRARSRINTARNIAAQAEMSELMEKNADIQAVMPDDSLSHATQHARSRAEIERMILTNPDGTASRWATAQPQELANAVNLVERAQRAGSSTAVNSAMALAQAQSGTGYNTSADMYESIIHASGGDRALEGSLLASARSASERAKRPDLALAGHVAQAGQLDRVRETMGGDAATHGARRGEVNATMRREAMAQGGAHAILNGRTAAVENEMQQIGLDYDAAIAAGDFDGATEIASQITSLRGAMGSAPPAARQAVMGLLDHVGVDPGAINPTTGQAYSTDEQLANRINRERLGAPVGPITIQQQAAAQSIAQEIRTRAGLYDGGGGNRTPEQLRAARPPEET